MENQLLLVGVGFMGRPYLESARDLGLRVRVVESMSWAAKTSDAVEVHRVAGLAAAGWLVDEIWAAGAYAVMGGGAVDGVLAFSEPHVLGAAIVADRLGLPGPSLHASILSRNKALQRGCFAAARLPQPQFTVAGDREHALTWASRRLPVIVKPLSSSGSAGVELVPDLNALRDVLERRQPETLLVEEAAEGPEFSWEGFIADGEVLFGSVTEKETTGPPFFVELSHRTGYHFADPGTDRAVKALAEGVVLAGGIQTAMVHLEFRVTAQGPSIMEVAVRTPGDFIADLLAASYGFSPFRAAVQLAMGMPPDLPNDSAPKSFPAAWFPVCRPGVITQISGLDQVTSHPMVTRAGLAARVGDVITPLESSDQRAGYVLIDAPSASERDQAMNEVRELLRITTEPAPP